MNRAKSAVKEPLYPAFEPYCRISRDWTHLISSEWDHPISG
jgi:hypothetical protein